MAIADEMRTGTTSALTSGHPTTIVIFSLTSVAGSFLAASALRRKFLRVRGSAIG